MKKSKKIALFGATSVIAKDFLSTFISNDDDTLFLFCRSPISLKKYCDSINLKKNIVINTYKDFNASLQFDVIINFIGCGDPQKLKKIGTEIIQINDYYDNVILDYLRVNKNTLYIYLSSGSVYNSDFFEPTTYKTFLNININKITSRHPYSTAKLLSELRHRALTNLKIVDLRVFNYLQFNFSLDGSSFISQIFNCLLSNNVFITNDINITRDFVDKELFKKAIFCIIENNKKNIAADLYSLAPVNKFKLLDYLKKNYSLKYRVSFDMKPVFADVTGIKPEYYSKYRKLEKLGYVPHQTSLGVIEKQLKLMLKE